MNRQQKEDYETLNMIESMIKSISNKELNHDETIETLGFIRHSIYLISLKNLLVIQEKIDTSFLDNESLNIERKEALTDSFNYSEIKIISPSREFYTNKVQLFTNIDWLIDYVKLIIVGFNHFHVIPCYVRN